MYKIAVFRGTSYVWASPLTTTLSNTRFAAFLQLTKHVFGVNGLSYKVFCLIELKFTAVYLSTLELLARTFYNDGFVKNLSFQKSKLETSVL